MHADDVAKLANFHNVDGCRIDGKPMLDEAMVNAYSPRHSCLRTLLSGMFLHTRSADQK